ncbi:MAG: hypothetical protein AA908_00415 [Chlorobi bacterium NICIL-2]|nr:MAG: hypothetical protein AA908_00415 [Chlorobi bacterium NICIL-2]
MDRHRILGLAWWIVFCTAVTLQAQPRQWNWEKLVLPPPYDRGFYLDVMFLPSNPQYGWACGFGGYVVRTTDGGNSWEGTTIPNADQLESIIFVNERVGYCSGTNNGNPNLGGIYKSTDGGRSWREITPVITLNGVLQRAPLWGCYFLDENVGMVVGGGCDGLPQLFFRTTDGGASWSLFVAYEPQTGMSHVLMYDAEGLCYASSSGRLWRSFDGGRSWQIFSVTGPAFWQENLANRGNTFLVATAGNTCTGGTGTIGDIRWSYDGGQTWSRYLTGASMFGTFLVDQDAGWAVGWNRAVYRIARDRGTGQVSVTPYRCGLEPGSNFDDVWFVNDTLGYLVGDGIYRTTMRDLLEPTIVSNTGQFVVCDSQAITLSVVKGDRIRQPYTEYLWSTGERTPTITVTRGGTYWVEVRDPDACYGKALAVNVTEAPSPKVDIRVLPPGRICEGDTIIVEAVLDSSAVAIAEYEWIGRTERSPRLVLIAQPGKLTFQLRARGVNGCEKVVGPVAIEVLPRPKPTIQLSKQLAVRADGAYVLCPGDQVELRASDGFATYQWNTGETTQSIVVRQAGRYWVTVNTGAIADVCSGTSQPVEIALGDTVKPHVLSDRGMRFCDGDRIVLRTDRSYQQYRWSTGEQSATIVVTAAGEYWVDATDEFGCSGRSDTVRVDVDPNPIEIVGTTGSLWQFDTTAATAVRCDSLRVRNISSQTLVIGSARLERNIEFSIPLAQLPVVIPPGQERWLIACFQPSGLGEQRDTLRVSDAADYCWRELTVVGICAANSYTATSSCNVGVQAQTQTFDIAGLLVVPPYPNPAQDEVRALVQAQDVTVILRRALGTECVQCTRGELGTHWWEYRCPLTQLPSGVYILELARGQQRWCYPVVVAR